jgi:hypothetical protein
VCSYSSATIFLLANGDVTCEDTAHDRKYKASSNVQLVNIVAFNGYLHGVSDQGTLYQLSNKCFPTSSWTWTPAAWAPEHITHVSATHDASHLWIQTSTTGYLFRNFSGPIHQEKISGTKRVYGKDKNTYLVIDPQTFSAVLYPEQRTISDIWYAALSYYDEVVAIHPDERDTYRGLTMVNWKPYYIRT